MRRQFRRPVAHAPARRLERPPRIEHARAHFRPLAQSLVSVILCGRDSSIGLVVSVFPHALRVLQVQRFLHFPQVVALMLLVSFCWPPSRQLI